MIRHSALLNTKVIAAASHLAALMDLDDPDALDEPGISWRYAVEFSVMKPVPNVNSKAKKTTSPIVVGSSTTIGATLQILVCSGTWHANSYHSATGFLTHWGTSTQGAPDRIDRVQATKLPDALMTKYTPLSTSGLTYLQSSLVTLVPRASQKETNKPFQRDAHLAHLWRLHAWFCAQIHQMISFTVWRKNSTFSWLKLNLHFLCLNPMFYAEITPFHA